MNLSVKLKASKVEARTKSSLMNKLRLGAYTSGPAGSYRSDINGSSMVLYNLEKKRRKTVQIRKKDGKYSKSKIVNNGGWTAYVYRIPVTLIETMGFKVDQKLRNFTIKRK